jgi:competence protein ComEC
MAQVGGIEPRSARGFAGEHAARSSILATLARQLEAEHDRWFLWLPVLFGSGIATYFLLPVEPSMLVAVLAAVAALALYLGGPRAGLAGPVSAAFLTATVGLGVAKLRTEFVRAPVLDAQVGPIDVYGFVELVEPRATKGQRLTILVAAMEKREANAWPARVRIRTLSENSALKPGDAVRVKATLSPPPGPALPGDYDFARAAWFSGLGAVGFAVGAAETDANVGEAPLSLRLSAAVARVRQAIGRRVVAALPGETGAIANALITGERGGISETTNQAFRASGLFHILSISGLHMVVMAGAVFVLIRLVLAAIPAIALRYPTKKWAAVGAMVGALGYLMISGAAFATVRSYIMISIMFVAVLLDRPALALRNVALAALLILLLWPESLLDPGFQMSFAAVVCLVSVYEWLRARDEAREGWMRRGPLARAMAFFGGIVTSTLVAGVAVAPFGVYHFHNTQQFAVLANLAAIPVCNMVVMPAALAALVAMPLGLEGIPLWVMGQGIRAMVWCAQAVAGLPGAVGRVPAMPTYAFVLMVIGGMWCALWGTRWRMLGVVPLALGLMLAPSARRPDVLIGRGAQLVAVRGADGQLSALAGRGSKFELARWLEHDGDGRAPAEVGKATAFRCDGLGCTTRVRGLRLAVAATPAALRDDCATAAIVVLKFARPEGCNPSVAIIDPEDLAARGPHALTIENGQVHVETSADMRGNRPWTPAARKQERQFLSADRLSPTSRRRRP